VPPSTTAAIAGSRYGIAHRLRRLARVAGEQHAAERRQAARDRERRHHDRLRARARQVGGPLAVADRVDGAPERRAREQEHGAAPTTIHTTSAFGTPSRLSPVAMKRIAGELESCGENPPVCTTISPARPR
jgi:hypothetical protein